MNAAADAEWLTVRERGSILGIRLLVVVSTVFGRRFGRAILKPLALYYALFHRVAHRASRRFLIRFYPRVTFGMVWRHVLTFAEVTLDQLFFMRGQLKLVVAKSNGFEHMRQARAAGRGGMLLGAHLGSVEAARVLAGAKDLPVNIVMYSANARMLNALLRQLNPEFTGRVIEIQPGSLDTLFQVKDLVDAGEIVALLGDRVGLNDKAVTVDFLGAPARFPTGPYLLAAMLKCPVFLTFNLYSSPNTYECFCEPFAERVDLPRHERDAALARYAKAYAARLEHYCKVSPYNWFNFYDFWRNGS